MPAAAYFRVRPLLMPDPFVLLPKALQLFHAKQVFKTTCAALEVSEVLDCML